MTNKLRRLTHFLAPLAQKRCACCLQPCSGHGSLALCQTCASQIKIRDKAFCPLCGALYPYVYAPCLPCPVCQQKSPPWESFAFYGSHEGALRHVLFRAKFAADKAAQALCGQLLLELYESRWIGASKPDALVPMPLHPIRLRQRGFNQCVEILRPLAHNLGMPISNTLLLRLAHTPPQTGLSRAARLANMRFAFQASQSVASKHVLLVDDTCTTGATLRRAAKALQRAGACVHVLVLSRA